MSSASYTVRRRYGGAHPTEKQMRLLNELIDESPDFASLSEATLAIIHTSDMNRRYARIMIDVLLVRKTLADEPDRKARVEAYLKATNQDATISDPDDI